MFGKREPNLDKLVISEDEAQKSCLMYHKKHGVLEQFKCWNIATSVMKTINKLSLFCFSDMVRSLGAFMDGYLEDVTFKLGCFLCLFSGLCRIVSLHESEPL